MKVIQIILVIILTIGATFALTAGSLSLTSKTLLTDTFYIETLKEANFYQSLEETPGLEILSFNSDGVEGKINEVITKVFSYLNGKTNDLSIKISLDINLIEKSLEEKVKYAKPCENQTTEEICIPPGMTKDDLVKAYLASYEQGNLLREEIDLAKEMGINEGGDARHSLDQMRRYVPFLKFFYLVLFTLLAINLFLIFLISRSFQLTSLLSGIIFGISSIIVFLLSLFTKMVSEEITNSIESDPSRNIEFLTPIITTIISKISESLVSKAIIIFLIAVIFLIIYVVLKLFLPESQKETNTFTEQSIVKEKIITKKNDSPKKTTQKK